MTAACARPRRAFVYPFVLELFAREWPVLLRDKTARYADARTLYDRLERWSESFDRPLRLRERVDHAGRGLKSWHLLRWSNSRGGWVCCGRLFVHTRIRRWDDTRRLPFTGRRPLMVYADAMER